MFRFIPILIFLFIVTTLAHGQEFTTVTPAALGNLNQELFFRSIDGDYLPLDPPVRSRGKPVRLSQAGGIRIFTKSVDPENGGTIWNTAAETSWASGMRTLLLLVIPRGREIALYALDDSLEAHPNNSIRLINFSQTRLGILLGEERKVIDRNGHAVLPFPGKAGSKVPFKIVIETDQGGEWSSYLTNFIQRRSSSLRSNFITYSQKDELSGLESLGSFAITGMPPSPPGPTAQ